MSRILLSGASGHVGTAILKRLAETDEVVALTSRKSSAERLAALPFATPPKVVVADLGSDDLSELLAGEWDAVVHIAAYIPPTRAGEDADASQLYSVNVRGTARLLAAVRGRARHLVLASSLAVYTPTTGTPAVLREDGPQVPGSGYGGSKLAAEKIAQMWAKDTGATLSILRIGTVYGPGETLMRALPSFFKSALAGIPIYLSGMGRARRNYVYIADVAQAVRKVLRERTSCVVNVGGDEIHTLHALADAVVKTCASSSQIFLLPGAADDVVLDMRRAHEDFGIHCSTPLPVGLAAQRDWLAAAGTPESDFFYFV